jgi:hypothetical protein
MGPAKDLHTDEGGLSSKKLRVNLFQTVPTDISMSIPIDAIEHVCPNLLLPERLEHALQDTLSTAINVVKCRPQPRTRLLYDFFSRSIVI